MFVRWASVVLRDLFFVAVIFTVLAGGTPDKKLHAYDKFVANKRVEAVARAICRAKGINPDHVGPPFPQGPLWELFIPDAVMFIAEYDAAGERK